MLRESCEEIGKLAKEHDITMVFSRAGREVIDMYGYPKMIKKAVNKVVYEENQGYSSPLVGKLGSFDLIVISPCTANTTAKIVYGIADSLVSNIAAQALKSGRKVIIAPTDGKRSVKAAIPSGKEIRIKCRDIDLENVRKLGEIKGVDVILELDEIKRFV